MARVDKPYKKPPDAYVKKMHATMSVCVNDAQRLVKEMEGMVAEMQDILDEHKDRVITLTKPGIQDRGAKTLVPPETS